MRIALPMQTGRLAPHFAHAEAFTLFEFAPDSRTVSGFLTVPAPPHQTGVLPKWLAEQGVTVVLTRGIGSRAHQMLEELGMEVMAGIASETPEQAVADYLAGTLQVGLNLSGQ